MSRILVDVTDDQLDALTAIVEAEQRPRAAIIRDAIASYITQHRRTPAAAAFGLWRDRHIDGLEYQERLRSEW